MRNRRKILEFIMAVTMLLLVYVCAATLPSVSVESSTVKTKGEKKIILLDAGHGGIDPGKVSVTGTNEKEINLEIAKKVQKKLEKEGITVIMTREEDKGLYEEKDSNKKVSDMKKRCRLAVESHADALVSIHQNSYPSAGVRGAQVFYYSNSEEGKKLAETLQMKLNELVDKENGRMAKENDSYYILLNVPCPAVIVECGFLSNYEEAELLEQKEYQEKIAEAICEGILAYYENKDR